MKLNKDMLMKIGIAAAILLVLYLVFRSRNCKDSFDGYADYVPEDEYSENMYEEQPADYAEEADEYYTEEDDQQPQIENFTLMESTLEDDEANAMFEPEM